jgi:hypothetical protein
LLKIYKEMMLGFCMGRIELNCSVKRGEDIVGYEFSICGKKFCVDRNNVVSGIMKNLECKYYKVIGDNFEERSELEEAIEDRNFEYIGFDYGMRRLGVVGV